MGRRKKVQNVELLDGDKNPELILRILAELKSSSKTWVKGYDALEE